MNHMFRDAKRGNYSVIPNAHLEDKYLSFASKGLHTYILSKPDRWKVILPEQISASTNEHESVCACILELYKARYWQKYSVKCKGKIDQGNRMKAGGKFVENHIIKKVTIKYDYPIRS